MKQLENRKDFPKVSSSPCCFSVHVHHLVSFSGSVKGSCYHLAVEVLVDN